MTRVLICDDSPFMRRLLTDLLSAGGMSVVGEAADGAALLATVRETRPDVITLDVEMPGMDGISALRELMRTAPTPVVMVSAFTARGARATVDALAAGAVDAVQKPPLGAGPAGWGPLRDDLLGRVRTAARARVRPLRAPRRGVVSMTAGPPGAALAAPAQGADATLVVIATSTGGPRALAEVLCRLPSPLGAGVIVVQHMPVGFTRSLAERLDLESALTVREAADGDQIRPDTALLAPGGQHLEVAMGRVHLSSAPPIGALRPRADVTLETAAKAYGRRVLVVVLTGMGNDGERGTAAVKRAGGRALAEDERTCVVYGMPRAIVLAGLADAVLPLDAMPLAIVEAVARGR